LIWYVDSCDCVLEINNRMNWIRSIGFCKLHKGLKGQNHLDQVTSQNRRFNYSMGENPIDDEQKLISLSKEVNKMKIRAGDFNEDIPDRPIEDLSYWQQIRNALRL